MLRNREGQYNRLGISIGEIVCNTGNKGGTCKIGLLQIIAERNNAGAGGWHSDTWDIVINISCLNLNSVGELQPFVFNYKVNVNCGCGDSRWH